MENSKPEEKKEEPPKQASFKALLRYISPTDKVLVIIGSISAIIAGLAMPTMVIMLGEITNAFDPNAAPEDTLGNLP